MFTLTGDAMTDRGNYYASLFIILAAGCLVFYFGMGWSVNVIAQVGAESFSTPPWESC